MKEVYMIKTRKVEDDIEALKSAKVSVKQRTSK